MEKQFISSDQALFLDQYAYLKQPTFDILKDFQFILKYQLNRFKDDVSPEDLNKLLMKQKCAKEFCSKNKFSTEHKTRLYLITDIDIPELVMFDTEDCILENMKFTFDIVGQKDPYVTPACYCNTLFIFDKKGKYVCDISSQKVAELIRCFHSENMLKNTSIRDSWYGAPRREKKSSCCR